MRNIETAIAVMAEGVAVRNGVVVVVGMAAGMDQVIRSVSDSIWAGLFRFIRRCRHSGIARTRLDITLGFRNARCRGYLFNETKSSISGMVFVSRRDTEDALPADQNSGIRNSADAQ